MDSRKMFTYHLIPIKLFPAFGICIQQGFVIARHQCSKVWKWSRISFPLMYHYCLMPVSLFRGDKEGNTNYVLHICVSFNVSVLHSMKRFSSLNWPKSGNYSGTITAGGSVHTGHIRYNAVVAIINMLLLLLMILFSFYSPNKALVYSASILFLETS